MNQPIPKGTVTIKKRLAVHQGAVKGWEYAPLARELNRWAKIFNEEWELALPVLPTIEYRPIRNAYATYDWSRGALGMQDTIAINTATLARPTAHIIRTLGHELLHLWQQYHGKPSKQRNYHNDEYVAKAASLGIVIDGSGCTAGHTEVFAALIEKHGIRLPQVTTDVDGALVGPTGGVEPKVYGNQGGKVRVGGMRKWTCGCTNVRCAVALQAVCAKCGQPFEEEG
jgi:hypothetical protein